MTPNAHFLQMGSSAPAPARKPLQAGPVSLAYEGGMLRYLRVGEKELLHSWYFALRDHNWGTVPGTVINEKVRVWERHFFITYTLLHQQPDPEIRFEWKVEIEGSAEGQIRFSIAGRAGCDFPKNRAGFCILHPAEPCAGQPLRVRHIDGSETAGFFPERISPHQPFKQIREMTWGHQPRATLLFEGDVFEMEDQRNWTDDSYKTYCTPLEWPFPVLLRTGEEVKQQVVFSVENLPRHLGETLPKGIRLRYDAARAFPLPAMGVGGSSVYARLDEVSRKAIHAIGFDHYRVEARPGVPGGAANLERQLAEAAALGLAAELVIFFSENGLAEAGLLAKSVKESGVKLARILLFSATHKVTPPEWQRTLYPVLKAHFPDVPVGAGTDAYFAELNRQPPDPGMADFFTFSINPQVHAFDPASLTETLQAQGYVLESARQLSGTKPVGISPVTFRPRFNPNATGPAPAVAPGDLPPETDPRQMSLYGAGWTLGSIKYLTMAGAESVTWYETAGARGLVQGPERPPFYAHFPAAPGMIFPLYHVLRLVCAHKDAGLLPLRSSDRLRADGFFLKKDLQLLGLVANFTGETQNILLEDLPAGKYSCQVMDEAAFRQHLYDPLPLVHLREAATEIAPFGLEFSLPPGAFALILPL